MPYDSYPSAPNLIQRFFASPFVKVMVMGFFILVLLIPLAMVHGLVSERQDRLRGVEAEVARTWASAQTVGALILAVPYQVHHLDAQGQPVTSKSVAYFLPDRVRIDGKVEGEVRRRGLFETLVYRADLDVQGAFATPDLTALVSAPGDVLWDDAELLLGLTDLRGLQKPITLEWQGRSLRFEPSTGRHAVLGSTIVARLGATAARELTANGPVGFKLDLPINGSGALRFLPLGQETTVALQSPWQNPSFDGAFLPESRTVGESGFEARWSVPYFSRNYPQSWAQALGQRTEVSDAVERSAFGAQLLLPVDVYQKTERSVKYGVLFLLLTFLTFFLYETFNPISVHPFQYLLVGAALCLFYLLLLSLAEHITFGWAYTVAATATVGLIGSYSLTVLRGRGRAVVMSLLLGALYGYLYVLLQAQDYALLLGSIGLFAVLAVVMFLTRNIDWTQIHGTEPGQETQA